MTVDAKVFFFFVRGVWGGGAVLIISKNLPLKGKFFEMVSWGGLGWLCPPQESPLPVPCPRALPPIFFRPKNFSTENFFGRKFFWPKNFSSEFFSSVHPSVVRPSVVRPSVVRPSDPDVLSTKKRR